MSTINCLTHYSSNIATSVQHGTKHVGFMENCCAVNKTSNIYHFNKNSSNAYGAEKRTSIQQERFSKDCHQLTSDDNLYLANTVGRELTRCLTELQEKMPADPIEWIAMWLYKHIDNKHYFKQNAKFLAALGKEKEKVDKERRARRKASNAMKSERKALAEELKSVSRKSPTPVGSFSPFGTSATTLSMLLGAAQGKGAFGMIPGLPGQHGKPSSQHSGHSHKGAKGLVKQLVGITSSHRDIYGREIFTGENGELMMMDEDNNMVLCDEEGNPTGVIVMDSQAILTQMSGIYLNKSFMELTAEQKASLFENLAKSAKKSYGDQGLFGSGVRTPIKMPELRKATWGVNARLMLVCQHPVLGDMEPRPPLCYETPDWWEKQQYLPNTLYDHEVYSRDTRRDVSNSAWEALEPLTMSDLLEIGPWLAADYWLTSEGTITELMVRPKNPVPIKYSRAPQEGDMFSREAKLHRQILINQSKESLKEAAEKRRESLESNRNVKNNTGAGKRGQHMIGSKYDTDKQSQVSSTISKGSKYHTNTHSQESSRTGKSQKPEIEKSSQRSSTKSNGS